MRFSISRSYSPHYEETKFDHAAVRIFVLDARDFVADGCQNPEFFFQFPAQSVARLLSFFNLSAGKFPLQRHGLMTRALAHQQFAVFHDQGCHDALHTWGTLDACNALATGSTQLVKVKAKAATPREQRNSSSCGPNSWLSTRKYMRAESTTT